MHACTRARASERTREHTHARAHARASGLAPCARRRARTLAGHLASHLASVRLRFASPHALSSGAPHRQGILGGGSIDMWNWYFGGECTVYAIDINPATRKHAAPNVHIFIGDQANRTFLQEVVAAAPPLDFVIDDGGHTMEQQLATLDVVFPAVRDGGVYLCEDTHTSYWPQVPRDDHMITT